jgi:hypothetical protein
MVSIRLKSRYSRSARTIPYQTLITPSLTIAMPSAAQIPEPVQPATLAPLWRATSLFYVAITFNPNEVADNMKKYKVVARLLKRSEIDGRSDDNEETVRVRLQVYAEQTEPLLKVYRSRGLLVDVDGLGEIEEVSERVFAALEAHREGKASELIEP